MFCDAETERATSTRLDMSRKVFFKYLIYISPEIWETDLPMASNASQKYTEFEITYRVSLIDM